MSQEILTLETTAGHVLTIGEDIPEAHEKLKGRILSIKAPPSRLQPWFTVEYSPPGKLVDGVGIVPQQRTMYVHPDHVVMYTEGRTDDRSQGC